jgi:hypothetical protein
MQDILDSRALATPPATMQRICVSLASAPDFIATTSVPGSKADASRPSRQVHVILQEPTFQIQHYANPGRPQKWNPGSLKLLIRDNIP